MSQRTHNAGQRAGYPVGHAYGDDKVRAHSRTRENPSKFGLTELWIVDTLNGANKLRLQTVPQEVEYTPNSKFVALASAGRNNPLYHYTGSEDIIKFSISWYSNEETRRDVIKSCRWLESMSKGDGDKGIHPVLLLMGTSLFNDNTQWLIQSAPYSMKLLSANNDAFPLLATQEITLARITPGNRTHAEITADITSWTIIDNSMPSLDKTKKPWERV